MCHAVSVTSDPTGPYYRYVFTRSLFPDYPRVTVWSDGYYNATSTGDTVIEKYACAVDRTRMLQGLDATEQCFIVPAVSFMEPSDLEGQTLPPAGEPEHYFAAGGHQLRGIFEDDGIYTYKFRVDCANPLNSTFTGAHQDPGRAVRHPVRRTAVPVRAPTGQHHTPRLTGRQDHAQRRVPQHNRGRPLRVRRVHGASRKPVGGEYHDHRGDRAGDVQPRRRPGARRCWLAATPYCSRCAAAPVIRSARPSRRPAVCGTTRRSASATTCGDRRQLAAIVRTARRRPGRRHRPLGRRRIQVRQLRPVIRHVRVRACRRQLSI